MVDAVAYPAPQRLQTSYWIKCWLQLKDKPAPPLLEGCEDADVIAKQRRPKT